jgi:hypothetical protein
MIIRLSVLAAFVAVGAVALGGGTARGAPTDQTTFASDASWSAFTADPGPTANPRGQKFLGYVELVCLNEFSPYACPTGAIDYGYPFGGGWPADLEAIPGAAWSWAPGVTGMTAPAPFARYFFSKTFILGGHPTGGTISIAADDFAEVLVNRTAVGTIGSTTDAGLASDAENTLHTFDLGAFLKPGRNTITVEAANGSASFSPICGEGCSYDENPAGVVFGGSLTFGR